MAKFTRSIFHSPYGDFRVKSFYFILESFFSILDPRVWEGIPGFLWGEMADDRSVAESETSTGVASIAATVDVDAASSVIADSSTATEVAPLPALPSPELQTPPGAEGGTADATGSESSRVLDPTGSTMDLDAIPRVSVKSHDGTEMDLTAAAQTDTHILLQTKENCVVNQYNTEVRALFSGALSKTSRSASNPAGEVDKAQVLTFGEKVFIGNQKSAAHFLLAFAREGDNGGEVIRAVVLKNGKTEAVDFNFVNVPPDKNNRKMGDIDFQNAKQARRTWLEANFTAHDPPPSRARQGPGGLRRSRRLQEEVPKQQPGEEEGDGGRDHSSRDALLRGRVAGCQQGRPCSGPRRRHLPTTLAAARRGARPPRHHPVYSRRPTAR